MNKIIPAVFVVGLALVTGVGCGDKKKEEVVPTRQLTLEMPSDEPVSTDAFFTDWPVVHLKLTLGESGLASLSAKAGESVAVDVQEGKRAWKGVELRTDPTSMALIRGETNKPSLWLQFSAENPYHQLRTIHLSNSENDDRFMARHLSSELFREAGIPAPRVTHAVVEINGEVRGLYVLSEWIDTTFLKEWFNDSSGALFGGTRGDIDKASFMNSPAKTESASGWSKAMQSLVAAANQADVGTRWAELQKVLDVEKFISLAAVEVMLTHTEGYSLNPVGYHVYADPNTGKYVFIPGLAEVVCKIPELSVVPVFNGSVADQLMDIPEALTLYTNRVSELLTNSFLVARMIDKVDRLQTRLRPVIEQVDPDNLRAHDLSVESLRLELSHRIRRLTELMEEPEMNPVRFDSDGLLKLTSWDPVNDYGDHTIGLVTNAISKQVEFHIKVGAQGDCRASWRTNFVLGPGRYSFEGRARCAMVVPASSSSGDGVGLRISGVKRTNRLVRDAEWTDLKHEFIFDVEGWGREVELIAELRADSGEAWFDPRAFRLRQVSRGVVEEAE